MRQSRTHLDHGTNTTSVKWCVCVLTEWKCTTSVPGQSPTPETDQPHCRQCRQWWMWRPAFGSGLDSECTPDTWGEVRVCEGMRNSFIFSAVWVVWSDLLSNQGCFVQARAERSFSASEAISAFVNSDHAKSHSAAPPAAIALQYTVVRRLGWILKRNDKDHRIRGQKTTFYRDKWHVGLTRILTGWSLCPSTAWTKSWPEFGIPHCQSCMPFSSHSPDCTWRTDTMESIIIFSGFFSRCFRNHICRQLVIERVQRFSGYVWGTWTKCLLRFARNKILDNFSVAKWESYFVISL